MGRTEGLLEEKEQKEKREEERCGIEKKTIKGKVRGSDSSYVLSRLLVCAMVVVCCSRRLERKKTTINIEECVVRNLNNCRHSIVPWQCSHSLRLASDSLSLSFSLVYACLLSRRCLYSLPLSSFIFTTVSSWTTLQLPFRFRPVPRPRK